MRLGDGPRGQIDDRTGNSGGFRLGGAGGSIMGLISQLVASRFGIVGILVLGLGYCALQSLGGTGGVIGQKSGESQLTKEQRDILEVTLGSTNQVWGQLYAQAGGRYQEPGLVAYSDYDQSGCGAAQAAMGPFYCPSDNSIYIDPQFFQDLSTRFGAPGDAAQAYVIAHEVGHHVQNLEGTLDSVRSAQARAGKVGANQLQVGVELQADCYAGVWAKRSGLLEAGDIEEGMRAAEAIGDDTLQRQAGGRVSPESFTHGSSAQRQNALRVGLESGDPAACSMERLAA